MNIKQQLEEIRILDTLINSKLLEIQSIREMATSICSVMKDMPESGKGVTSDRVGNFATKLVDLENEINAEIDKLYDIRKNCIETMKRLSPIEYKIVYLRYFKFMSWLQIGDEVGYSKEGARQTCFRAIKSMELNKS